MLTTAVTLLAGFLVSRNIYNQDNYRYLVLLLLPWSMGSGLLLRRLSPSPGGRLAGYALAVLVAACSRATSWRGIVEWAGSTIDCCPVLKRLEDPAESWLDEHPEVGSIYGSYWDVYRLSFLTGGRVVGVPFPLFPDRFPVWSAVLPGGRPETLLVRWTPEGHLFLNRAIRGGGGPLQCTGTRRVALARERSRKSSRSHRDAQVVGDCMPGGAFGQTRKGARSTAQRGL